MLVRCYKNKTCGILSAKGGPRKKPGLSRKPTSSAPSPDFLLFIFDLKMASFDAFWVVFYAI